jgi:choline dehydrogenase-like flavoprotein
MRGSKGNVKWHDLRSFEDGSVLETDLCIVGSGPAGLSIAKEFAGTGIEVWVVESGGRTEDPELQTLYEIESVGAPRVMQQDIIRYRIWGGTSHIWSGRCAPFDETDFEARDWVPYSGWRLTRQELDPYLTRAGDNLGLGPQCYTEALWQQLKVDRPTPLLDSDRLEPAFWQSSKSLHNPKIPARFGQSFLPDAPNLNGLLHANVTHIDTNATGREVEAIEVTTLEGKRAWIKAKVTVLCCGGVENARLLLASNRILPNGVGNPYDTVGRFLMDHPGCVIGEFDPRRSGKVQDRFGQYWLDNDRGRHVYLHGVKLSPKIQAKEGLLNCAAFLEEYAAPDDPWVAIRQVRSALKNRGTATEDSVAQAMFWRKDANDPAARSIYQDGLAVAAQPHRVGQGLYRRLVQHRPPIAKASAVQLYCLVEQRPDPNSRITLSDKTDRLGMPLSKIDWRISQQEKQTVRRMGQLVQQEFQRMGLPQPTLAHWLDNLKADFPFTDRAHPVGTTRMCVNPKEGVVDDNCKVHDVEGLYLAGSSVFPTTGHANPTLMIVALSIRLADWLKTREFRTSTAALTIASKETLPLNSAEMAKP